MWSRQGCFASATSIRSLVRRRPYVALRVVGKPSHRLVNSIRPSAPYHKVPVTMIGTGPDNADMILRRTNN